jgi:hypothetical protein
MEKKGEATFLEIVKWMGYKKELTHKRRVPCRSRRKRFALIADIRQQSHLRTISALNAARRSGNAMNAVILCRLLSRRRCVQDATRSVSLET